MVGSLTELSSTIEVVPGPELTRLEVTRTFFNPTFSAEQLSLAIHLPCDAILDELQVRGPDDARGRPTWVPGTLIDPVAASERFDEYRFFADGDALEADTIAVLSRPNTCEADLDLFPVPPLRERSVRYRIQVPANYTEGRYRVELPTFELDQHGATLTVADPVVAGFELAIDPVEDAPASPLGPAGSASRELSGLSPHVLTLTPIDPSRPRVSLAAISSVDLGHSGQASVSVGAAELDLPTRLVDLPAVQRVVVVVDASHSFDHWARDSTQTLAAAYLDALALAQPDARVEVLHFDREVRRVHGEFVEPAIASAQLRTPSTDSRNGSEPGLAIAHARELLAAARQPGETGVDWLILLGDLELRDGFSLTAELDAAERSDVRMHVIHPGTEVSLAPMPADDPWMAIAQAAGGANFGYILADDSLIRDGAELLTPNRVWDVQVIHSDARGRSTHVTLLDELATGERVRWLERLAGPAIDRVEFAAFSWAKPLTWSAKASSSARRRWAGSLSTGETQAIELDEAESRALAELAHAVSPWTSLIAEAKFAGRSMQPEQLSFSGHGWSGSGCSMSCGSGHGRRGPTFGLDLSVLRSAIEQAIGECDQLEPGSLTLEILDDEIVVVESRQACAREAIWALDLRAWPSFGHPIIQIGFDERGVHQLQSTALDGDALVTYAE